MTERDDGMKEYLHALRESSRTAPDTEVDWDAFHRRLAAAAELPLERLRDSRATPDALRRAPRARPTAPWWDYVARWSRATLPLAAASGIVLGFVIRTSPRFEDAMTSETVAVGETIVDARSAFESAVIGRGEIGMATSMLLPATSDVLAGAASSTERR